MRIGKAVVACLVAGAVGVAGAQWATDFEAPDYSGSPAGTVLTGQQGWYLPAGIDYNVFTYADNAYGVPQNPQGGRQFVAGMSAGGTDYARAQHDYDWGNTGIFTVYYDIAVGFDGALPATDYLGSFSLQPSTDARYWQTLFAWDDLNVAEEWTATYVTLENAVPGVAPGPEWENLDPDHWYRQGTKFNMDTGEILEVSIEDLDTGVKTTVTPQGWHMMNPSGIDPTAFRFFTGGTTEGNINAWDNFTLIPEPTSLSLLALCVCAGLRRR